MPIYEYECEKCNNTFEAMQSVSAKPLKICNKSSCKGKVHRLVSASGFIFKGLVGSPQNILQMLEKKDGNPRVRTLQPTRAQVLMGIPLVKKPLPLHLRLKLRLKKQLPNHPRKNLPRKIRIPEVKSLALKPPPNTNGG